MVRGAGGAFFSWTAGLRNGGASRLGTGRFVGFGEAVRVLFSSLS